MSTYAWSPAPRPAAGWVEVLDVTCRCGRALYVDLRFGQALDRERCRGCDEIAPECYCPSATVSA